MSADIYDQMVHILDRYGQAARNGERDDRAIAAAATAGTSTPNATDSCANSVAANRRHRRRAGHYQRRSEAKKAMTTPPEPSPLRYRPEALDVLFGDSR
jgi:hypothetical protein